MELKTIWLKAKKKFSLKAADKKDFIETCKEYKRQHGHYPLVAKMQKKKVPGLASSIKFLVNIGKSPAIMYRPGKKSRKGDHNYLHETKNQNLLTDKSGQILIYQGQTKMKKDGWLHY